MTETKVFIHVGLHKTGTTFLQNEIFPKIPNINYQRHVDLTTRVVSGKVNLFSDENLDGGSYRIFNTVQHRYNIMENLHTLYPTAKIIICIRDRDKWLQSAYKQYVVAYYSYSFRDYCKRLDPKFTDFDEYIEKLRYWFDDVYVCHYEDLVKNPKEFVNGICDFIGVETPEYENKIIYKGITDGQVKFIRLFDKIFKSKLLHFMLSIGIRVVRKDETIKKWQSRKY